MNSHPPVGVSEFRRMGAKALPFGWFKRSASVQVIASGGSGSAISWDTEVLDKWGMWASGVNITIPVSGTWLITYEVLHLRDALGGTSDRHAWINLPAGVGSLGGRTSSPTLTKFATQDLSLSTGLIVPLEVGNVVGVTTFQDSGVDQDVLAYVQLTMLYGV